MWSDEDCVWLYITELRDREVGRWAVKRGEVSGRPYDPLESRAERRQDDGDDDLDDQEE